MPKKGLHCLCILVIITDTVFEMGKDYLSVSIFRKMQI